MNLKTEIDIDINLKLLKTKLNKLINKHNRLKLYENKFFRILYCFYLKKFHLIKNDFQTFVNKTKKNKKTIAILNRIKDVECKYSMMIFETMKLVKYLENESTKCKNKTFIRNKYLKIFLY